MFVPLLLLQLVILCISAVETLLRMTCLQAMSLNMRLGTYLTHKTC